ncbi:quaternary ammonium compound efflux SMR transporter SugE [Conexibacter woesei]|uniref:Small multidrug resistance protein n=1 Tax=Conexibacter woesei (strain DSM 14684 / CCUG 47730 / CIP 108061 / JCM 11494 / NBRC 100937 / ID131577) TaxID=469383 RepID=D3FDT6_CONWI|nr:quaternary ammonium compound efflux SMR transporter SugE [Conexibacter woesei]ADB49660.1 small multidrug resistance protein [Conexibacter woesei DSM 14684]
MAWIFLIVAGLLEVGWAIGLKYTEGFTKLAPTIPTVLAMILSLTLLSFAAKTLPIGTAYAIFVGIGAAGAAVLGIILFHEPAGAARIFFLMMLLASVVGLKLSSGH